MLQATSLITEATTQQCLIPSKSIKVMPIPQPKTEDRGVRYCHNLPPEVWQLVIVTLDPSSICALSKTNRAFHHLSNSDTVWRKQCSRHGPRHSYEMLQAHVGYAAQMRKQLHVSGTNAVYRRAFEIYATNRRKWFGNPIDFNTVQAHHHGISSVQVCSMADLIRSPGSHTAMHGFYRVYTGGWDGDVKVWSKSPHSEFEYVGCLKGLVGPVECIKIKGGFIVAGSSGNGISNNERSPQTLKSWPVNLCTQPLLSSVKSSSAIPYSHLSHSTATPAPTSNFTTFDDALTKMCLDHNGSTLIIVGQGSQITLHDLDTYLPLWRTDRPGMLICDIHWVSFTSNIVFIACQTGAVTLWKICTSTCGLPYLVELSRVTSVSGMISSRIMNSDLTKDTWIVLCGYKDGSVRRWKVQCKSGIQLSESTLSTNSVFDEALVQLTKAVEWVQLPSLMSKYDHCDWVSCLDVALFDDLVVTGSWDCKCPTSMPI
ncbi:hypothetical protein BASA50_003021 [Batrachochytrium salamandrivorans]|uniref:F-box domain-containing protein n=1 Tax=Batrachochytrium salamandrivorans TaxID=1357716 RepID=A0ABQ8FJL1_9FUNG|nr:hypothetical protein BASA60_009221 [Batrachochytrium salamandrivorans]KAH6567222.1 hypothetical protein BASA62_006242 [Batrachochytrium salamandrivorans]KAH6584058.1 hypothetical protein BASA61_007706 [Batrachochytrium salamandrivorans]KAH6599425.1 hypothetical protein BASA50_003021 [Batrachochytrium salamandrivorans]KAH9269042.1 hypothetical protein BASA83_008918 [Batrachochytrium salamandrivorans]